MSAFSSAPSYRTMRPDEFMVSAIDQPMSIWSTLADQAKGGILQTYGLGPVIKEALTPDALDTAPGQTERQVFDRATVRTGRPMGAAVGEAFGKLENRERALSEEDWRKSPNYRENIPYDEGMTTERAAALAEWSDIKAARQFYAEKRPITAFIGNLGGQALDPINYVPIAGPAVRAAAVARYGRVAGTALVASGEAAVSTAIAGAISAPFRAKFGDDVSLEAAVSEIATAALIGGAFGGIVGAFGRRADARQRELMARAEEKLATFKRTQESRVTLNDAVQTLAIDGEVRVSPATRQTVRETAKAARDVVVAERRAQAEAARPTDDLDAIYLEELNAVYGRQEVTDGQSLFGQIAARGGIRLDDLQGEEVRAVLQDARLPPGVINNRTGRNADDVARSLWEDGFFGGVSAERPDLNTFYDALAREARGERVFVEDAAVARADIEARRADLERLISDAGVADIRNRKAAAKKIAEYVRATRAATPERRPADEQAVMPETDDADRWWYDFDDRADLQAQGWDVEPIPFFDTNDVEVASAASRVASPEDIRAAADQYGVNPETGEFIEMADIDRLREEGRLSDEDAADIESATAAYDLGVAYGEAMKSAVGCLL